ncbi:MAG: hypothetical protein QMD00_02400 [Hadesarchaea archaeon]|nr:hypothetical protein [Hadesarchaea archaeon]
MLYGHVRKLFFEKLKMLGVRFKEGRFQERLEGVDMNQIGYLIPAEVKIDGEELVATLKESFAFVF